MLETLTQKELKSKLQYNPNTGIFIYIKNGLLAGGINNHGYNQIKFNYTLYKSHRLAWLYMYGKFPKGYIDHINGNKNDNKISNLRTVTRIGNARNAKLRHDNTSGKQGVTFHTHSNRWVARIGNGNKRIFLGSFKNKEDAISVRIEAENKYNYHKNHGRV